MTALPPRGFGLLLAAAAAIIAADLFVLGWPVGLLAGPLAFLFVGKFSRRLRLFGQRAKSIMAGAWPILGVVEGPHMSIQADRALEIADRVVVGIEQYAAQHGRLPQRLEDLVPAHTVSLPQVGLLGRPMKRLEYHRYSDTDWCLEWSVRVSPRMFGPTGARCRPKR